MKTITVNTQPPYRVLVGAGQLKQAGSSIRAISDCKRAAILTDHTVGALYGETLTSSLGAAGIQSVTLSIPPGENHKNLATLGDLYGQLAKNEITRSDLLIALGGGVVGDITGLLAATYLRGLAFVGIPTTLLSAVDAAVGGKNGVDLPEGKNLVGTFLQPQLVLHDTDTLNTLPEAEFIGGSAEVLKYGALFDGDLFSAVAKGALKTDSTDVICRCIAHKAAVVEQDEHDTGRRMLLNFGHTLGHAIERETGYGVSHGMAVAMGMAEITKITESRGITAPGTYQSLVAALRALDLPISSPVPLENLMGAMQGDKKRQGKTLQLVVLRQIGEGICYPVPVSELTEFFCVKGDS